MQIQINDFIKGDAKDSLPETGWIHTCLICNQPTSRIFKYFYNKKIYGCYFCKDCLPNKNLINKYTHEILLKINK